MSVTTVVLADDHHLVRHSLRIMLETKPGFRVVGEAEGGAEPRRGRPCRRPGRVNAQVAQGVGQDGGEAVV